MSHADATMRRDATMGAAPRSDGVTFARVLVSEWIKLVSIRSTYWTSIIIVVLWIGLAAIFATSGRFSVPAADGTVAPLSDAAARSATVLTATAGVSLGVLIAGIQGVLVVSGEYSTGMIRSTLVAVPKRVPVLLAKAVVIYVWMFLLGTVSTLGAYALAAAPLSSKGALAALDGTVLLALLGAPTFLGLVAVFGVGIGALVRSGAGGIAITIGVLFVLPVLVSLGSIVADWISDVSPYLLSSVGSSMTAIPSDAADTTRSSDPGPALATLVAAIWAAVALALGLARFSRQDV